MATHSPQKTHQCSFCEKMFHRKDHLKNHLQTHDPNKEAFKCQECGKHYNTKLGYKRHVALHSATSGDLTCKVCLQGYESTPVLLEHLKSHSGKSSGGAKEKKHPCDHCDRRFYTRKDVRRHMVVHTGRKDFLCQYCAQRFGRKDHLTRHVKKSHARELLRVKTEPDDSLETFVCDLEPPAGFKGELPPPAAPLPRPLQLNVYAAAAAAVAGVAPDLEPFPGPMHPFSLKYPLGQPGFTSYGAMSAAQERDQSLKGELETYLMELSAMPSSSSSTSSAAAAATAAAQLSVSKLELGPQVLAEEGEGEVSPMSKMAASGPASGGAVAGDALASSSSLLDFSQLFNYLPMHGPPYNPAGAGPAVTLGAPYPPAHEPTALVRSPEGPEGPEAREGALQGLPASFISNLSAPTTLPRFHQAFQ